MAAERTSGAGNDLVCDLTLTTGRRRLAGTGPAVGAGRPRSTPATWPQRRRDRFSAGSSDGPATVFAGAQFHVRPGLPATGRNPASLLHRLATRNPDLRTRCPRWASLLGEGSYTGHDVPVVGEGITDDAAARIHGVGVSYDLEGPGVGRDRGGDGRAGGGSRGTLSAPGKRTLTEGLRGAAQRDAGAAVEVVVGSVDAVERDAITQFRIAVSGRDRSSLFSCVNA